MQGGNLGPYRLDRELGAGGMGTVWKAVAADGTTVAIKVVHSHLAEQAGFRERFDREARSGLAIASPNVVRTIACIETESDGKTVPALVLEFVEGRDLAALLAETGRVPEDLCRHLAREIARGLAAVHAAGIVHRDLKPGNVLLTGTGEVKVMDLGLARQASGEDRMSQTGLFLGTAAYAPPEQFFGKKDLDPRSDLYSLGAMLYELTTGRVPFEAEGIGDLVRKVLRDRAPRVGVLAPQTTPFFEEFVATLLEKEPDRRFASATELGDVLDAGEAGDWWAATAMRRQMETRKPLRRVSVQRETELWGREDDLGELRGLWERAKHGSGVVVLLEGEAGIGKTRLVEELLAAIACEEEAQILVGRHDPAGEGSAAEALAAAFRAHLGVDDLDAQLGDLLSATPLLVPAFAALLRGTSAPEGAAALTPDAVQTLFVQLTRAVAAVSPLVLVVDDLHFATDESRALFRAVALAVETSPVLVVGTARPGLPAKWVESVTARGHATRHEVRRLDGDTVRAALVRYLGGGQAAESVAERISSRAGGNPYFVVSMLRLLGEQGCLARSAEGRWSVTSVPPELVLPENVRDLVASRLASLAAADRHLLDACACQGYEFDGRLAAETLGRSRMEVLRALGRLEHATRLVRAAGTRFAFDHHVVHEVVYATTPAARRESLHAAVADGIERQSGAASVDPAKLPGQVCADLASHLLKGARGARALRYLDPALGHLETRFGNEAAVGLCHAALAVPGLLAEEKRIDVLLRAAERLGLLGRKDAERAALDEALALAESLAEGPGGASPRAQARNALAAHLTRMARFSEAETLLGETLEIARAAGDRRAEIVATGYLANVIYIVGRHAAAQEQFERMRACAREAGDRVREAAAIVNTGLVLAALGRHAEAKAQHERGRMLCREIGHRHFEANATCGLGIVLFALGRHAEAQAQHERHLALSREIGDRRGEATARGNLGIASYFFGRYAEAEAHHERNLVLSREIGDRLGEATSLVNLGPIRLLLGDPPGARRCNSAALTMSREIGVRRVEGYGLFWLASVAEAEDGPAVALRLAEEALAVRREIRHGGGIEESLRQIAGLRRRGGDIDGARAAAEEALSLARGAGRMAQVACCLTFLAAFPGGDAAAAESALSDAGDALAAPDAMVARFHLWQATKRPAHLAEAKRVLDFVVEHAPPSCRDSMLTIVPIHREIVAACNDRGP